MFVLTVDQRQSTTRGDLVPELLTAASRWTDRLEGVELPFERTVGDEVQAVVSSPRSTLVLVLGILRTGGWRTGLGVGEVRAPLPSHSREASGPAFVRARSAIDRAKKRSSAVPVAVEGPDRGASADVEALLHLLGAIVGRRTAAGWEVVDLLDGDGDGGAGPRSQQEVARRLGLSAQAVSQRVRASLWAEERAAWPLATRLLAALDADAATGEGASV